MILYELTRGLAYRRIQHASMTWYTRRIPLALTVVGSAFILVLPAPPMLLGKDGLVAGSLSVLSTLPGFYFAGLAAVATFNGLNMDAVMSAPAPTIDVTYGGARSSVELSRRQFLSYLFSYLVLISFALCVLSLFALAATPSLEMLRDAAQKSAIYSRGWDILRAVGIISYVALASSVLVSTLHGMFFLTERIHQP